MKKKLGVFVVCFVCAYFAAAGKGSLAEASPDGVAINKKNFSDFVLNEAQYRDTNRDGYLSKEEASKVKHFTSTDPNPVDSFKGLEYFEDMEVFDWDAWVSDEEGDEDDGDSEWKPDKDASKAMKATLNLSGFKKLRSISILSGYPLGAINIKECASLEDAYIEINCKKLTISDCPKLESLFCQDSLLKKLDLSGLKKLSRVGISARRTETIGILETLKLKNCKNLKELYIEEQPKLSSLDLKGCAKLEEIELIDCSSLKKLDLSDNVLLKEFTCQDTKISSLDLKRNVKLKKADLKNNSRLKEVKLSKCTKLAELNVNGCAKLVELSLKKNKNIKTLDCSNTEISSLNLKKNQKLSYLECTSTNIQKLDLSATQITSESGVKCDEGVSVVYAQ